MREIKFRGKTVEEGRWVYGSYQADVMLMEKHTIIYSDHEGFYCEDEVLLDSIGQYIGIKDRSGKEIYEKDIVKGHYWRNGKDNRIIGEIRYVGPSFMVYGVKQYQGLVEEFNRLFVVIGNRFDNPELLEETK